MENSQSPEPRSPHSVLPQVPPQEDLFAQGDPKVDPALSMQPAPNSQPSEHSASPQMHPNPSAAHPEPAADPSTEPPAPTDTPAEHPADASNPNPHDQDNQDNEPSATVPSVLTPSDTPGTEPSSLEDFAARSQRRRLNLEEETQAAAQLRTILLNGRAEVARAIGVIPSLPWTITVQGTAAAWPDMKPSFRSQLLAGLAKAEGDSAARVRLSLARGLFKVDPAATLKLILLTLKVLRDKSTGLLTGKGAPFFANVLIGRGKAWILQVPTAELKPAEMDLLVNAALHAAFHAPQAPITQLSILKWAGALGKLEDRPPAIDQLVSKGVSKWSGKWQATLRQEVASLPESWLSNLKLSSSAAPASSQRPGRSSHRLPRGSRAPAEEEPLEPSDLPEDTLPENPDSPDPTEAADDYSESHEPRHRESTRGEEENSFESEEHDSEDEVDSSNASKSPESPGSSESSEAAPPARRPRPVYVSRTVPSQSQNPPYVSNASASGSSATSAPSGHRRSGLPPHFNLSDSLRQIEQYAAGLRSELQAAQKQLRQREDDRRSRRPEKPAPISGEPSLEELARLNQQLESRNAELAARLEELSTDSEDRAASQGLSIDAPSPDADAQLRSLLTFKLREDFEDFRALEEASKDLVVQQHYQSILRHVFEVLQHEGVVFPPQEARPEAFPEA